MGVVVGFSQAGIPLVVEAEEEVMVMICLGCMATRRLSLPIIILITTSNNNHITSLSNSIIIKLVGCLASTTCLLCPAMVVVEEVVLLVIRLGHLLLPHLSLEQPMEVEAERGIRSGVLLPLSLRLRHQMTLALIHSVKVEVV